MIRLPSTCHYVTVRPTGRNSGRWTVTLGLGDLAHNLAGSYETRELAMSVGAGACTRLWRREVGRRGLVLADVDPEICLIHLQREGQQPTADSPLWARFRHPGFHQTRAVTRGQASYERRIRERHPEWTEDEIQRAVASQRETRRRRSAKR